MTCDDCLNGLPLYIAGQLPGDENIAMARHIAGCDSCRRELAEETAFARRVHTASVPFREAALRVEKQLSVQAAPAGQARRTFTIFSGGISFARAALATGVLIAASAVFLLLRNAGGGQDAATDTAMEELTTWAVGHFPLIDQTHPLRGDAGAVRTWFRVHHALDVAPPRNADYSTLAGCKMAEFNAEAAPLLRFVGKDTSAVFLLPAKLLALAGSRAGTLRKDGFTIRLWSEGEYPYLGISRDPG